MNQNIYKLSEPQEKYQSQLSQEDIQEFVAYFKLQKSMGRMTSEFYDWDVNRRENRQFYINKRQKGISRKASQQLSRSIARSVVSVKSSKKSTKPKLQFAKKADELNAEVEKMEFKIQQQPPSQTERPRASINQSSFFPSSIPQESNYIPNTSIDKNFNLASQKQEVKQISEEEVIIIPEEHSLKQPKISVLPMIDKNSPKGRYYDFNQPKLDSLNEFIVEPQRVEEFSHINSRVYKIENVNNHRRQKTEMSKQSTPVNKTQLKEEVKKQHSESLLIRDQEPIVDFQFSEVKILTHKQSQKPRTSKISQLPVQTTQKRHFEYKQQKKSVSRSKSKTNIRQVKDSYINLRRPKIYQIHPTQSSLLPEEQVELERSSSPQFNPEPISHVKNPRPSQNTVVQNSRKKIFDSKRSFNQNSSPLPVQDYDKVFDKPHISHFPEQEKDSEFDENIIALSPSVNRNVKVSSKLNGYGEQYQKESINDRTVVVHEQYDNNPLQYFSIPLYTLNKGNHLTSKEGSKINQKVRPRQIDITIDDPDAVIQQRCEKQKSSRRRIFSQVEKQPHPSENVSSTDVSSYNDQEMRMLLGAGGNKYKETIVRQYIKIQRAQRAQRT